MKPSPWIMFMGGIAVVNVAMLVGGLHAPAWVRYPAMVLLAGIGVFSIGTGLHRGLAKKPERPRFVPKRKRPPDA